MLASDIAIIVVIASSTVDSEFGAFIRGSIIRSENIRIVCICVVFLILVLLMFMVILFVVEYAIKAELVVTDLGNYNEPETRKKPRIYQKQDRDQPPAQE